MSVNKLFEIILHWVAAEWLKTSVTCAHITLQSMQVTEETAQKPEKARKNTEYFVTASTS